ncbi:uncharacterized protein [Chironomus tepperi]|uniref:uncharacterized protein n=1 Tax=Chironomus tepperi TaxID=113505 RepID=UPI00391F2F7E
MSKIQILVKIIILNLLASPLETFNFQLNTINPVDKTLGLSVTEIAKDYYLKSNSYLNIVKSIKPENLNEFIDVMDTIISTLKVYEIAYQFEDTKTIHQAINTKRSANLVFIDSVESFNRILKVLNSAYFNIGKVITIISFKELAILEMEKMFNLLFKQQLLSVNILTNFNKTINLYTFLPFRDYLNCENTTPFIISTFDGYSGKWNSNNFYKRKASDLMKCPLRIGTAAVSSEPGIMFRKLGNGKIEIYGVEKDIFDELSVRLNFTTDYVPYFNGVGTVYPNGTGIGVLGNVLRNEIEVGIGFVSLQYIRTLFLSVTHYYRIDTLMLVVPPGEEYGSLEKLFLPFEMTVWIAFYFVLITSVIFSIISFKFPRVYEFVIGKKINQPIMNIMAIHLGVSQSKLPSRNFSRFILLNMLIYCLILRSAYQGAFFNSMVSNKSKPSAATMDEMLQKKYTLFAFETLAARLQGFSFYN